MEENKLSASKVILKLPLVAEPNTLYFVRVGLGFDLYCSDATGNIVHALNKPTPSDFFFDGGNAFSDRNFLITIDFN